jgi:hypothetical protein
MTTVQEQISTLRQKTRELIQDLYKAGMDYDTFESVLLPVKDDTPELPVSPIPEKKPKKVPRYARPLQRTAITPTRPIITRKKELEKTIYQDIDVLNQDDEFFESIKEFRNLYADQFISKPEPQKRPKTVKKGIDLDVEIEEKLVEKMGFYRVNRDLFIEKKQVSYRGMDQVYTSNLSETDSSVKVSIPNGTFHQPIKSKRMEPKTANEYRERDSVYLGDVNQFNLVFTQGI